ncbi:hypothetical protein TBLA_0C05590 [Henningerozyma blattae CBS 6284]|uniref:Protein kinase domain-containing protein n=1 Tax=Henningerozyma blattae (strain ATCC 34711 / CBS 6284 / DSM 70876 / NBRC 10599 / NRRL Y-10934 / UCD 77-7) TaxID=1071380 RepID=I2H1V5_HENB6|nr:hypothetical protein TBLA_0C05590 [Tetrapisispora blattae CBS 6284]CCH60357.1 hypothetical protein TBLA_0C05590 [Tetrapisispora blattae CBS 6284]
MNFTNIFKSISNFQFPYSIEDTPIHSTPLWQVFNGTRKSDSTPVTVFKANRSPDNERLILNATHKAKVIKIPGLCPVLETFDTDAQSTFIVTEHVIPFNWDNLKDLNRNKESIQLGISQIADTLDHLTQFVLGNLSKESIYINSKGQWVLFGLELCQDKNSLNLSEFKTNLYSYNKFMGTQILTDDPKTIDSILLGNFVKAVYTGNLPNDWSKLISSAATLSLKQLISKLKNSSTWNSNSLIQIYQELKEIHIKDERDKMVVMINLQHLFFDNPQSFKHLSPNTIEGMLIPELCTSIQLLIKSQATQGATVNNPVSKIVPLLSIVLTLTTDINYFPNEVKEIFFNCFKLQDRQTRFLLLIYFSKIKDCFTQNEISGRIFPHYSQGLADSDKTMRLQTLKKIPLIVPYLTERQLNNELLRFLAKTQVDPDIEIRTWTVLIMTKISTNLSKSSGNRANILATVFTKSLKDPNIKPRLAALYGLTESIDLFDIVTIANKILTVIAPGLLDKNPLVRTKAKMLFNKYLNKLESEAKIMHEDNEEEIAATDINFDKYQMETDDLAEQFMSNLRISIPNEPVFDDSEHISSDLTNNNNSIITTNNDDNLWDQFDHKESDNFGWDQEEEITNNFDDGWDNDDSNNWNDDTANALTNDIVTQGKKIPITKSWNDELNDDTNTINGTNDHVTRLRLGRKKTSSILSKARNASQTSILSKTKNTSQTSIISKARNDSQTSIRKISEIKTKPIAKKAVTKPASTGTDDFDDAWDDAW